MQTVDSRRCPALYGIATSIEQPSATMSAFGSNGMSDLTPGNAIIGQSGGPTAVINQSLVGVIEGLRNGLHAAGIVKRIYGMRHGVRGLTKSDADLFDFTDIHQDRL